MSKKYGYELTLTEGIRALIKEEITLELWVSSCLERIKERENYVGAWEYIDEFNALKSAANFDKYASDKSLKGFPFSAKDIIDTVDIKTSYGSKIYSKNIPSRDASCIAITKASGGILVGKTVTTEFGHVFPGKTKNPCNLDHTPGGSSSGSAASVGDKMIPFSYGTQTTGSVIRPASYCGTVGYKPTIGDFNLSGVFSNSPSFDTLGIISRSVEDIELIRSILLENFKFPPKTVDTRRINIGVVRSPFWEEAEKYTQNIFETFSSKLSKMGAKVIDVELPGIDTEVERLHGIISGFEFSRTIAWERINHREKLSKPLREGRMADGLNTCYNEYRRYTRILEKLRLENDDFIGKFDVLITPSSSGEAPMGVQSTGKAHFNIIASVLGLPAITLPLFEGPNRLPVGIQLMNKRNGDEKLLQISKAIMRLMG